MRFRIFRLAGFAGLAGALMLPFGLTRVQARTARAAIAPTRAQIFNRIAHTHEVGSNRTTFRPVGKALTILDGRGTGTLTAVVGRRFPTADGKGQLVFFWHNNRFNGLSANYETAAVNALGSPAAGTFVITYARFKATDPLCCPTVAPLKVTYGWSGRLLISNGAPPRFGSVAIRVKYRP